MGEPKWTPGPWEVERWQSGDVWIVARHSHVIARMTNNIYIPTEQKDADARLVAAAPDLYEALEFAVAKLREYADHDEMANGEGYGCMTQPYEFIREAVEKGEAALRKARGGSS